MTRLLNEVKWKRTLRWLRRCFPVPPGRVTVRCVPKEKMGKYDGEPDHGESSIYSDGKFVILINRNKAFDGRIFTLLHEWAHILTWFEYGDEEEHASEWGVIYARIYREHEKWDFGRKRGQKRKPLPGQRTFKFFNSKS